MHSFCMSAGCFIVYLQLLEDLFLVDLEFAIEKGADVLFFSVQKEWTDKLKARSHINKAVCVHFSYFLNFFAF